MKHHIPEVEDLAPDRPAIDLEAAKEQLESLCGQPLTDDEQLQTLTTQMVAAGEGEAAFGILNRHFGQPDTTALVSPAWVLAGRATGRLSEVGERLARFDWDTEAWHLAAQAFIDELGRTGDGNEHLRNQMVLNFVRQHRRLIIRNTATWAAAGRAMHAVTGPVDVMHWMADWRHKPGLAAAMLVPWIVAAWELNRLDDATEAAEAALKLPADESTNFHRAHAALLRFVDGKPGEAAELLAAIDGEPAEPGGRGLWLLATALHETITADNRRATYAEAAGVLSATIRQCVGRWRQPADMMLRRAARLARAALASAYGKPIRAWWHRRKARQT